MIFILYPYQLFQKFLSLFPINWHFLHALVDSFQGCYKDRREPGTFDCRWFSVITLIPYFAYALIVLLILIIALINIQTYKKMPSKYPPTDLMFLCQLSFTYVTILGREYSSLDIYQYFHTLWIAVSLAVGFIPFTYTCFLIDLWLFSRRKWIICK